MTKTKKSNNSKIIVVAAAPAAPKIPKRNKTKQNKAKNRNSLGVQLKNLDAKKVLVLRSLLNNPCGEIPRDISSVTGTGLVRVIRTVITMKALAGLTSGYVVWFPSYHGRGCQAGYPGGTGTAAGLPTNGNIFTFEATGPGGGPSTALLATPLWSGVTSYSSVGCTYSDPCYGLLGPTFRDAATLASCMKFRYLGQTSTNQGAVGAIENIDMAAVITTDGSTTFGPVTSNLLTYSETRDRPQMEAAEVKWAPTNGAGTLFRGPGDFGSNNVISNATDTLVRVGVSGSSYTQLSENAPSSNTGIGFAWNGLNGAVTNDVEIEFIKVVQLRLSPVSGMRESETIAPTPELFTHATQVLDNMNPSWRTTASNMANYAADRALSALSNAALGGMGRMARRGRITDM